MDIGGIREAMHQQPFRPFELRLADGRSILVRHPEFIAIAPNSRRIVVFAPPDDAMSILEPLLIVSIEYPATAPAAPGSNGTSGTSG
jgi:hypothetical protein